MDKHTTAMERGCVASADFSTESETILKSPSNMTSDNHPAVVKPYKSPEIYADFWYYWIMPKSSNPNK